MNKKIKAATVSAYFNEILPDVGCELVYHKDYELLIAVMLSAQTTDKAVNKATAVLFEKFPRLEALNEASVEQIGACIHSLGLYQNKARNLKGIVAKLLQEYQGVVPSSREELIQFPGVGRKTANVVRCELFSLAEFPVDTHIERIAKRLSFAKENDNVLVVEQKLRGAFTPDQYIRLHHQFIHFGRYYCHSKSPDCAACKLHECCNYFKNANKSKKADIHKDMIPQ